jgi:predicted molibdopterin-dependent oxidoreductase YjgC
MTPSNPFDPCAGEPDAGYLRFTFDGEEMRVREGQTVAAALLSVGRRAWRFTSRRGEPRGLFCGMGMCYDCLVRVDGRANVLACQTLVVEGMRIETQRGAGSEEVLE